MTDEKIIFEEDGSYQRGGERVEELDVQAPKTKKRSLADVATSVSTTVKPTRAHIVASGTFNLDTLRASAVKASTTAAEVLLPEPGETEFKKVKTVSAPKTRKAEKVATAPVAAKKVAAPVPEAVTESKPTMKARGDGKVEESPKAPVESLTSMETSVQEPALDESVKDKDKDVTPLDLSCLRSISSSALHTVKEGGAAAEDKEVATTSEEKGIDESPSVSPVRPGEAVALGSQKSEKDSASQSGFIIVTLKKFLQLASLDDYSFAKWCRSCVVKATSMPGSIFCAAFNEQIRFYNFFLGKSPQWFGAVVGCGDNIVCVQIQQKSLVMQDDSMRIKSSGGKITLDGAVMALYGERLREARKV